MVQLERVVVVPAAHDLAGIDSAPVSELVERPLLYIPAAPPAMMSPFVLGDVRPLRDARLAPTDAVDSRSIIGRLRPRQAVLVGESSWPASLLRPGLHELRLPELPPIEMCVASRRRDRRDIVRSLADALPGVAASMRSDMRALWAARTAAVAVADVRACQPKDAGRIGEYEADPID